MKSTLIVLIAVVTAAATLAVASPIAGAQPPGHPANGVWEAIDPVDGSNLTVRVSGPSDRARLLLFDDRATIACPVRDSAAVAWGGGAWVGDSLDLTVRIRCLGEPSPGPVALNFTYDSATDTLMSGAEAYTRR